MFKNKVGVPFMACASEIPLITFRLDNGTEGVAVVDTGSEQTVFDSAFIKENDDCFKFKEGRTYSLIGIATESEAMAVSIATSFHFGGETIEIAGVSADMSSLRSHFKKSYGDQFDIVAIFGSDMMLKLGTKIDFIKKEIKFNK